jgi:hypothetical protein
MGQLEQPHNGRVSGKGFIRHRNSQRLAGFGLLSGPHRGNEGIERRPGLALEHNTRVGERNAFGVTAKEFDANLTLQPPDLLTQAGLGDPQPDRGASNMALVGKHEEVAQACGMQTDDRHSLSCDATTSIGRHHVRCARCRQTGVSPATILVVERVDVRRSAV